MTKIKNNFVESDKNENLAISLKNVSKMYKLYDDPEKRVNQKLIEFLTFGIKNYHHQFWALKDISIDIPKKRTVGVLGKNGSGKSTLLKIIAGITFPTAGQVKVRGRVASLLELGTGFNDELTGIENVYLHGSIMGFSKKQMDIKYDKIENFAQIGEYIKQPLKFYSSGMKMRLGFACAINVDPDILIIDEALAVGDSDFSSKCVDKVNDFIKMEKTVFFVSHSMELIKDICDIVIWLDKGNIKMIGDSKVVDNYIASK